MYIFLLLLKHLFALEEIRKLKDGLTMTGVIVIRQDTYIHFKGTY